MDYMAWKSLGKSYQDVLSSLTVDTVKDLLIDCRQLDCCAQAQSKKKQEPEMGYASASAVGLVTENLEAKQRDYLISRLRDVRNEKDEALRLQFGLSQKGPTTWAEAIQMIKDGKVRRSEMITDNQKVSDPLYFVRWNLVPPDQAGYDAAYETLKTNYTAAKDQIMVGALADGLKALQTFQA